MRSVCFLTGGFLLPCFRNCEPVLWHSRDLDALEYSLAGGGISAFDTPCMVEVDGGEMG